MQYHIWLGQMDKNCHKSKSFHFYNKKIVVEISISQIDNTIATRIAFFLGICFSYSTQTLFLVACLSFFCFCFAI